MCIKENIMILTLAINGQLTFKILTPTSTPNWLPHAQTNNAMHSEWMDKFALMCQQLYDITIHTQTGNCLSAFGGQF